MTTYSHIKIDETEGRGYNCSKCPKVCKSKGGLTLHNRTKHPEVNESAKPDYDRIASDKLSPSQLENMIVDIVVEVSKDDCYPAEMRKELEKAKVKVSNDDTIYKECVGCLALMLKKNDVEKFYEKFYSSLPLKAKSLLHDTIPESSSKIVVLLLADKLLAFLKPHDSQDQTVQISLKDTERGPLNYLGGYILRNLHRKCSKQSKKTNVNEEKEEFMALLDSLHVPEPVGNDSSFISAKDRGGLWYPKKYFTDIIVTAELHFRVQTGKEVCHKICMDKIVGYLLKQPILKSKWSMLVEECGCQITERRSLVFLDQILMLYIKIRSFSYAKDVVQKYKLNQKAAKQKALRKEIQRATNQ